ncbi:MAG: helix-turn-helix domain-containing protein [Anaerolineae bacterium]
MSTRQSFGAWLKEKRKEAGLTQEVLAALAGCSTIYLRKIEADERRPTRQLVESLLAALQLPHQDRAAGLQLVQAEGDSAADVYTNLPTPLTEWIGREREVAQLKALLQQASARLVTLTGTGGVGKTRLAIKVASCLLDSFRDGVYFVDLAPVAAASLIVPAIAAVLGVHDDGSGLLLEKLKAILRKKRLLLILDNFEQLVEAAPLVVELLQAAPSVKALITSREVLHVRGEKEFIVPPLSTPDPARMPRVDQLMQCEAVRLFAERAHDVRPDFELLAETAGIIAEICYRLDGLPLAIELAAARLWAFTPEHLLVQLGQRLKALTDGPADLPQRQQTLRSTITWSYDLLDTNEKRLFRRLAVFVRGFSLDAAEAVCGEGEPEVAEHLSSLLAKSLVQRLSLSATAVRYRMLETVREFALEHLDESGETPTIQERHALHYRQLARTASDALKGSDQALWLDRLDLEHENIRAAIQWAAANGQVELGLQLSVSMARFWLVRGYIGEGSRWLGALLNLRPEMDSASTLTGPSREEARRLIEAGVLGHHGGDISRTTTLLLESVESFRQLGSEEGTAASLFCLGHIGHAHGNYHTAAALYHTALKAFRAHQNRWWTAVVLQNLACIAVCEGDYVTGRELAEESLALFREMDEKRGIAWVLDSLGHLAFESGDFREADVLYTESMALFTELRDYDAASASLAALSFTKAIQGSVVDAETLAWESLNLNRQFGHRDAEAASLRALGYLASYQGHHSAAAGHFINAFEVGRSLGNPATMAAALSGLACANVQHGIWQLAACLFAAAQASLVATGSRLQLGDRREYERNLELLRDNLTRDDFDAAWRKGESMTLEDALASAVTRMPVLLDEISRPVGPRAA